jgi:hypothetical protein
MVDISSIYKSNSDYLNAEEIGDQMWEVTIFSADVKKFDNGDQKIVLGFDETDKVLPLNVTNARAIGDMHGTNTEDWLNKKIMLFTMPVDFQGKTVQAIRIRAPQKATTPQRRSTPASDPARDSRFEGRGYDDRNPPPPSDDDLPGDYPTDRGGRRTHPLGAG